MTVLVICPGFEPLHQLVLTGLTAVSSQALGDMEGISEAGRVRVDDHTKLSQPASVPGRRFLTLTMNR